MMKRVAIIIGILCLLIIGSLWTWYTVRKSAIKDQYVSSSSGRILSIAIDDLVLDNLPNLFSWNKDTQENEKGKHWIKNMMFNAGIEIPARIFLFNMSPNEGQFYGILSLKNYDDCFSFFAEEFPDEIDLIDKEKGIVCVSLNTNSKVIFDRSHLIYELSFATNPSFTVLQNLLEKPDSWTKIGSLTGFEGAISDKHISYSQKDGNLQIQAIVSKHKTKVEGKWKLAQSVKDAFQLRQIDTSNQVITFWNLLPLQEVPALAQIMNKYTGVDLEKLNNHYFDFLVKDEYSLQTDSSITYGYDDDFNPIEEIQVKEVQVPSITYSWHYSPILAASLPDTMFYKVHKKEIGPYLINSTLDSFTTQVISQETKHPLSCYIDFGKWPETWNFSVAKQLKDKKVKVNLLTTLESQNEVQIAGEISY